MDEQKKLENLDETGSARRRLLKAAGLSAVAGLVTLDWRKPSIHVGSLPAHAQGSEGVCGTNPFGDPGTILASMTWEEGDAELALFLFTTGGPVVNRKSASSASPSSQVVPALVVFQTPPEQTATK